MTKGLRNIPVIFCSDNITLFKYMCVVLTVCAKTNVIGKGLHSTMQKDNGFMNTYQKSTCRYVLRDIGFVCNVLPLPLVYVLFVIVVSKSLLP